MQPSIILPICLLVAGFAGIGLSIPMLFNKISRNELYGFRTKLTLSSDEVWFPANRFAAKALICWGIVNVLAAALAFGLRPLSNTAQLFFIIPPLSVIFFYVVSVIWVNRTYGKGN